VLLTIHQARRNAWVYRNVAGSDASASQSGRGAPLTPLTACPRDVPLATRVLRISSRSQVCGYARVQTADPQACGTAWAPVQRLKLHQVSDSWQTPTALRAYAPIRGTPSTWL